MTKKAMLKVKIKSLAAESRIIRLAVKQEKNDAVKYHLHCHRIYDIRIESRFSQLAYGFIRGREYEQIEKKAKIEPDWKRVKALVEKFGECHFWQEGYESYKNLASRKSQQNDSFEKWLTRAKNVLAHQDSSV